MKKRNSKQNSPLAIALQYDGENAPRVTAKGYNELAERIIELARKHEVPMQENEPLTALLSRVELGDEIPEALYIAVAQIIAFTYHLSGKVPKAKIR